MYRRAICQSLNRSDKAGIFQQSNVPGVCRRLVHDSRLLASPSMHGPGGQPSGTPVLNKSLKKQPTRDDAPSKGDQPAKDDQATQGGDANSTTGDSNPKLDPTSSGTRITSKTPLGSKGLHTLTTFKIPHSRQNSSLQTSSLFAQAKGNKEFP